MATKAPPAPKAGQAGAGQATAPAASNEAALADLEQLTARLEAGQLPLDELLASYQRGSALLRYCREQLDAVDAQVKLLDQGEIKAWTPE